GRARQGRAGREDRARRAGTDRRGRRGDGLRRGALLAALAVAACAKAPPPPPPATSVAPPPLAETPLPPTGTAAFEVGAISQTGSGDGHDLYVESSVRNIGSRASREVKVWVDGLDASGGRVARVEALPTPQEIPPGAAASFVVRLPNDPAIRSFHVE